MKHGWNTEIKNPCCIRVPSVATTPPTFFCELQGPIRDDIMLAVIVDVVANNSGYNHGQEETVGGVGPARGKEGGF